MRICNADLVGQSRSTFSKNEHKGESEGQA